MTEATATRNRRYSDEFKRLAVARVRNGERYDDIARDLGITGPMVRRWTKVEDGTYVPCAVTPVPKPAPRAVRVGSPELVEAVLTDLEAKVPWREIVVRHGVATSTIYKWAKRSGRFLFGEKAIVRKAEGERVGERWWIRTRGVDEASATLAIRMLREGCTRPELSRATGWPEHRATAFARKSNTFLGTPLLLPSKRQGRSGKPRESSIAWDADDRLDPVSLVDLGTVGIVHRWRTTRSREDISMALELVASGRTAKSVAAEIGVCVGTLRRWRDIAAAGRLPETALLRSGPVVAVVPARRMSLLDLAEKKAILSEVAAGESCALVAARHRVSYAAVYRLMRLSPAFEHGKSRVRGMRRGPSTPMEEIHAEPFRDVG